jgi:hypothetical protein
MLNAIDLLVELARQVRQGTLELLNATEPAWLTWTPRGTSNHILWHAGHALWLQDALTISQLTGRSELPPGWVARFGQNSRPETVTDWPPVTEVYERLVQQLDRILVLLKQEQDTIAAGALGTLSDGSGALLARMIHGWHDEARHQGEMYLLYKLCRTR